MAGVAAKKRYSQPRPSPKLNSSHGKKREKEMRELWFNPHATEMRASQIELSDCDCECQVLREEKVQRELQRIARVYSQVDMAVDEGEEEEEQSKGCCALSKSKPKSKEKRTESKRMSDKATTNSNKTESLRSRGSSAARRNSERRRERSQSQQVNCNCQFETREEAKRFKELKMIYTTRPRPRPAPMDSKKKDKKQSKRRDSASERCSGSSSDDSMYNIREKKQRKTHKSRMATRCSDRRPRPHLSTNSDYPQRSYLRQKAESKGKKLRNVGCCGRRNKSDDDDDDDAYRPVQNSYVVRDQRTNLPKNPFTAEELKLLQKLRATYTQEDAKQNKRPGEEKAEETGYHSSSSKKKKRQLTEDDSYHSIYSQYPYDPYGNNVCRCAENDSETFKKKYPIGESSSEIFTHNIQACNEKSCRVDKEQYCEYDNATFGSKYSTEEEDWNAKFLPKKSELEEECENELETTESVSRKPKLGQNRKQTQDSSPQKPICCYCIGHQKPKFKIDTDTDWITEEVTDTTCCESNVCKMQKTRPKPLEEIENEKTKQPIEPESNRQISNDMLIKSELEKQASNESLNQPELEQEVSSERSFETKLETAIPKEIQAIPEEESNKVPFIQSKPSVSSYKESDFIEERNFIDFSTKKSIQKEVLNISCCSLQSLPQKPATKPSSSCCPVGKKHQQSKSIDSKNTHPVDRSKKLDQQSNQQKPSKISLSCCPYVNWKTLQKPTDSRKKLPQIKRQQMKVEGEAFKDTTSCCSFGKKAKTKKWDVSENKHLDPTETEVLIQKPPKKYSWWYRIDNSEKLQMPVGSKKKLAQTKTEEMAEDKCPIKSILCCRFSKKKKLDASQKTMSDYAGSNEKKPAKIYPSCYPTFVSKFKLIGPKDSKTKPSNVEESENAKQKPSGTSSCCPIAWTQLSQEDIDSKKNAPEKAPFCLGICIKHSVDKQTNDRRSNSMENKTILCFPFKKRDKSENRLDSYENPAKKKPKKLQQKQSKTSSCCPMVKKQNKNAIGETENRENIKKGESERSALCCPVASKKDRSKQDTIRQKPLKISSCCPSFRKEKPDQEISFNKNEPVEKPISCFPICVNFIEQNSDDMAYKASGRKSCCPFVGKETLQSKPSDSQKKPSSAEKSKNGEQKPYELSCLIVRKNEIHKNTRMTSCCPAIKLLNMNDHMDLRSQEKVDKEASNKPTQCCVFGRKNESKEQGYFENKSVTNKRPDSLKSKSSKVSICCTSFKKERSNPSSLKTEEPKDTKKKPEKLDQKSCKPFSCFPITNKQTSQKRVDLKVKPTETKSPTTCCPIGLKYNPEKIYSITKALNRKENKLYSTSSCCPCVRRKETQRESIFEATTRLTNKQKNKEKPVDAKKKPSIAAKPEKLKPKPSNPLSCCPIFNSRKVEDFRKMPPTKTENYRKKPSISKERRNSEERSFKISSCCSVEKKKKSQKRDKLQKIRERYKNKSAESITDKQAPEISTLGFPTVRSKPSIRKRSTEIDDDECRTEASNFSYCEALYNDLENIGAQKYRNPDLQRAVKEQEKTQNNKKQESQRKSKETTELETKKAMRKEVKPNIIQQNPKPVTNSKENTQRKKNLKSESVEETASIKQPPLAVSCYVTSDSEIRQNYEPEYVLGKPYDRGVTLAQARQAQYTIILDSRTRQKCYKDSDKASPTNYFYGNGELDGQD